MYRDEDDLQLLAEVAGVLEAGWNEKHLWGKTSERDRSFNQSKLTTQLKGFLDKVKVSPHAWVLLNNDSLDPRAAAALVAVSYFEKSWLACLVEKGSGRSQNIMCSRA